MEETLKYIYIIRNNNMKLHSIDFRRIVILNILFLCGGVCSLHAQVNNDSTKYYYPTNDCPQRAVALTDEVKIMLSDFKSPVDSDSVNTNKSLWFYIKANEGLPEVEFNIAEGIRELKVYGPFESDYSEATEEVLSNEATPLVDMASETAADAQTSISIDQMDEEGLYLLKIGSYSYESELTISSSEPLMKSLEKDVKDKPRYCVGCEDGKMPEPGKYLISAWVSMSGQSPTTTSFVGPSIDIYTSSGVQTIIPDESRYIIDGWQLLEGEFYIPSGNDTLAIILQCAGEGHPDCYYDDIRIQPLQASMKTYVYDPMTLRLVAELDERHYSTLYEYDEDGQLKRIKKETERGIKTIQESAYKTIQHD